MTTIQDSIKEVEAQIKPVIDRLTKDLRQRAREMTRDEARYIVDIYYQIQGMRVAVANQLKQLENESNPRACIGFICRQMTMLESRARSMLDEWSNAHPMGQWARQYRGIGPVLSSGLLAHIDIDKAPTMGHVWSFAGLNPTVKWLGAEGARKLMGEVYSLVPDDGGGRDEYAMTPAELAEYERIIADHAARPELSAEQIMAISRLTGRKFGNLLRLAKDKEGKVTRASMTRALARRPWNATLKCLAWKIGTSFWMQKPELSFYRRVFDERKAKEQARNDAGELAAQAAEKLATVRIGKSTEAYGHYSAGRLPPAHIQARAIRYTAKMFLGHWWQAAYELRYGVKPPRPYVVEHLGHVHEIPPPPGERAGGDEDE